MKIAHSDVFAKLERRDSETVVSAILDTCVSRFHRGMPSLVNFLYYANAEMRHVFEIEKRTPDDERYAETLMECDYLLPDGIALSLSYFRWSHPEVHPLQTLVSYRSIGDSALPNLNGTDLLPRLLHAFRERFWESATGYFYGALPEVVERAARILSAQTWMSIGFQDGFSAFDFDAFERFSNGPKILFVGLGTPKQEIFCNENAARFSTTLAITVGGFFDFVGGGETRAPQIVRQLRLEWLWRVILNPKKNGKKAWMSLKFFPRYFGGFDS